MDSLRESQIDPGSGRSKRASIWVLIVGTAALVGIYWYVVRQAVLARAEVVALDGKRRLNEDALNKIRDEKTKLGDDLKKLGDERDRLRQELSEAQAAIAALDRSFRDAPPDVVIRQVLNATRAETPHGRAMSLYTTARLALEEGRNERAKALLEASVHEDENYAPALTSLGRVLATTNQGKAEALYRRAMTVDPTYKYAFHDLAHLLHMQRKNVEARQLVERTLQLDPNFEQAAELLASIERAPPPP